jgi:hypothetical protein
VPYDNTAEPGSELRDGPGPTRSQGLLALLEFRAEPFGDGTAPDRQLPSLGWAAHVRQAEAVAGLWCPLATSLAPFSGRAPNFYEAGLLRGQCEGASVASLPPCAQQLLGGVFGLDTDSASVTGAHDHDLAPCMPATPLGGPEVQP